MPPSFSNALVTESHTRRICTSFSMSDAPVGCEGEASCARIEDHAEYVQKYSRCAGGRPAAPLSTQAMITHARKLHRHSLLRKHAAS